MHTMKNFATAAVLLALTTLAGCGFQLRGSATLPFETMHIQAPAGSQFATQLRRSITNGSQTRIVDNPKEAQATLQVLNEAREKSILSLSSGGRVREYQLRYRVSYRVMDRDNRETVARTEIALRRDLSYNDADTLSKESEEALLYRDMQSDAVNQMVRQLQMARPPAKT
jgi:LPS-assembly lipoprotein